MLHSKLDAEKMLFNYETSYKSDFTHWEIREYPKTVHKPKTQTVNPPIPSFTAIKNLHTMSEWKGEAPPFSLMHAPKDIIRTNPYTVPKPYVQKTEDKDKETAVKTRPRLVMTPAVSIDDIADPAAREILITDMYTSEVKRQMKMATAALPARVKAPLPVLPAPANPISLPKLQPPYVSPEWRMETITWDGKQLRAHCDPTAEFWRARLNRLNEVRPKVQFATEPPLSTIIEN